MSTTTTQLKPSLDPNAPAPVPAGFKRTEVGVMPEDWDVQTLGSLTTRMTNGFVGTATTAYTESDDGVLYIQGYNVKENGFNLHGIKRVSKSFHAQHQKSCLLAGDLLTIQTGDIGVTAVVPPSLAGANCHALVISRLDTRASDPDFLCQYFNSAVGRAAFKKIETGSTMKHLNVGDMVRLEVASPSLDEQRAIAEALLDVDRLIMALAKLIAKKQATKRGAMQQLLTGKTRLPGFSGEWRHCTLGEMGQLFKGKGIRRDDVRSDGVACVRYGELYTRYHNYVVNLISRVSRMTATDAQPIRYGDLLFTGSGETAEEIGKCVAYVGHESAVAGGDIVILRIAGGHDAVFLGHLLNLDRVAHQKAALGQGDAVVHISSRALAQIELEIPLPAEQSAIASVLVDMDAEIEALSSRLAKTRDIKRGMMQELLTGRTRLVPPKKTAA